MKKLFSMAIFSLVSFSVQAYDCSILLIQERTHMILRSYHGYGFGGDMCRDELRACKRDSKTQFGHMNTRCEKLDRYYSGTGVYTPGGVVINPGPVVVNPGPVVVSPTPVSFGKTTLVIENQVMQIASTQIGDIFLGCMDLARAVTSSIDEIMVTVGNGRTIYRYTSGYWNDQDACMAIQSAANESMVTNLSVRPFQVVGAVENYSFSSTGLKADIAADCLQFLRGISGSVDELVISVNGSQMRRAYTSGWYSDMTACRAMMNIVDEFSI